MTDTTTWFCQCNCMSAKESAPEEVPDPDLLRIAVLPGPAIVTMSASHIIKDEVMEVTYMDTMTPQWGR